MPVYKHGNWWYYDFLFEGQRYRQKAGRTKTEAERAEAKARSEAVAGLHNIRTSNKRILIEDFAQLYLARRKHMRSHKRDALSVKTLLSFFKKQSLQSITPDLIEDYKQKRLKDRVSHATINRELSALKKMYNLAIEWDCGYNGDNPVSRVRFLEEPPARIRFLTEDEIKRLVEACPPHLRPITLMALSTGMRLNEILSLRWQNVFLDDSNSHVKLEKTKNNRGRIIPLNDTLLQALEQIDRKSEFVFLNQKGSSRLYSVRKPFGRVLREVGISDFRFHDLRHTFASHYLMNGGDLISLKEILGHSSLDMVMKYAHFAKAYVQGKIRKLDKLFT